jgi:hypothetical protein
MGKPKQKKNVGPKIGLLVLKRMSQYGLCLVKMLARRAAHRDSYFLLPEFKGIWGTFLRIAAALERYFWDNRHKIKKCLVLTTRISATNLREELVQLLIRLMEMYNEAEGQKVADVLACLIQGGFVLYIVLI